MYNFIRKKQSILYKISETEDKFINYISLCWSRIDIFIDPDELSKFLVHEHLQVDLTG